MSFAYPLGHHYEKCLGVEKSLVKAAAIYRNAADQAYSPAYGKLASMYADGRGVEQSDAEAAVWFELGSRRPDQAGYLEHFERFGEMLEAGRGVEQSDERAVQIYMTTSQAGYG